MKKLSFIVILLISLIAISCKPKPAEEAAAPAGDTAVYNVKTIPVKKQIVSQNIEYTANLIAFEEINYAPASPGRIEEINVEIGSRVSKGDVIVRMEQTQLLNAKEQLENARSNFQRMDTLRKLNSISEQQYETVKTQYEMAKTNVDFLAKNTTLISPINGIVTGKYFESGEIYSGAPNTSAGKAAVVTLMQINPLKARINVSERFYPSIKKGMKAVVKADIYPERNFSGEVYRVYPVISPDTRTFTVELVINNPAEVLRPGMFTRVSIDMGETSALVLPAISVLKQEGTNDRYVFIAQDNGTAKRVDVGVSERYDDKIEIVSDEISEGDRLIISGQEKLLDGSMIRIVEN